MEREVTNHEVNDEIEAMIRDGLIDREIDGKLYLTERGQAALDLLQVTDPGTYARIFRDRFH